MVAGLNTAHSPRVAAQGIGREGEVLVTIDDFAADPDALRAAAAAAAFEPARHHYPGVRAPLPETYLSAQLPLIARQLREVFGRHGAVEVVDASFSIVTTPRDALSQHQRLPHCDAFAPDRFALVHFLCHAPADGTAFFRHRATGFEMVTDARAATYFATLQGEIAAGGELDPDYVTGDTPLFERVALGEARHNRALIYPGFLLHSGAIPPAARLSSDPLRGRLTVTGFFSTAR